jgi:hypothetical protein
VKRMINRTVCTDPADTSEENALWGDVQTTIVAPSDPFKGASPRSFAINELRSMKIPSISDDIWQTEPARAVKEFPVITTADGEVYQVNDSLEHGGKEVSVRSWRRRNPSNGFQFNVELEFEGRVLTVPFGHPVPIATEFPNAAEIMGHLIFDASNVLDFPTFEQWAEAMEVSSDSRSAERDYNTMVDRTSDLKELLGDAYSEAVIDTTYEQPLEASRKRNWIVGLGHEWNPTLK